MILTEEQSKELQNRYQAEADKKGDTLNWSEQFYIRKEFYDNLRNEIVTKTASASLPEILPTVTDEAL